MKSIQDTILDALKNRPMNREEPAPEPKNPAVEIALASIRRRKKMDMWRAAVQQALRKGHFSFAQILSVTAKFETAVARTGNYEKAFLWVVEEFGNSDAQQELAKAKASFLQE